MDLKLSDVIKQVGNEKGVKQSVLIETLEVAISTAAKRVFGQQREIEAYYNAENDEIELFQILRVCESVDNPYRDMTLQDAEDYGFSDVSLGDELLIQIFYRPEDAFRAKEQDKNYGELLNLESARMTFGRIAAQTAKGWIGTDGKPIRNWRTWFDGWYARNVSVKARPAPTSMQYDQRAYTDDELHALTDFMEGEDDG